MLEIGDPQHYCLIADISGKGKFGQTLVGNLGNVTGDLFCLYPTDGAQKKSEAQQYAQDSAQSFSNRPVFHFDIFLRFFDSDIGIIILL